MEKSVFASFFADQKTVISRKKIILGHPVGRFSEAGLQSECPCNLSHKKSQEVRVSLPGQFLRRHCFMLWITMEVEPRLAKQYKCHHCCSCKNYRGKGMEGGKKVCRCCFLLIRRSQVHEKNAFWGIL